MTVFIEVISDWFNKSVFGHQKELGLKQDSFTENEMIFFGLICANKQREISEQEYLEGYAIALSRKVKQIKEEYAKKSCELLCKTCNIGVCGEDQKCHRYKGFRKAMEG